ncbi:predicted protein [Naegleria gruberi]|uniref:Predicted protein n=1 Tax=Naegleria gruberi TaxID=5762 RepID=D2VCZ8_NAEGR|nr:uncharacterized protein NAEGRDRAFT_48540 [Naegleria gruberi]EFC45393.1 predicted protein [Naegleria gruberi]|eukprot:XP_002678137.1 predicted protein [Naegleria gruberi strain NEG-M]
MDRGGSSSSQNDLMNSPNNTNPTNLDLFNIIKELVTKVNNNNSSEPKKKKKEEKKSKKEDKKDVKTKENKKTKKNEKKKKSQQLSPSTPPLLEQPLPPPSVEIPIPSAEVLDDLTPPIMEETCEVSLLAQPNFVEQMLQMDEIEEDRMYESHSHYEPGDEYENVMDLDEAEYCDISDEDPERIEHAREEDLLKRKEEEECTNEDLLGLSKQFPQMMLDKLYSHQKRGVKFLWENLAKGNGCILADFMGMGKTLQTASTLCVDEDFKEYLLNPGPDVIVLDEGHKIRHLSSKITRALNSVNTQKRIILTGYPFQNNLLEYWTMINFVCPMYLGEKNEFKRKYSKPIQKGQLSKIPYERRIARRRSWLLYEKVKSIILRRDASLLKKLLPQKQEILLTLSNSEIQRKMYKILIDSLKLIGKPSIFWTYDVVIMLCNHPDVLYNYYKWKEKQAETQKIEKEAKDSKKKEKESYSAEEETNNGEVFDPSIDDEEIESYIDKEVDTGEEGKEPQKKDSTEAIAKTILSEIFKCPENMGYKRGALDNGGKMILLFSVMFQCKSVGDRLIVFSRSINTLNFIENTLKRYNKDKDAKGQLNFMRFDGSTPFDQRQSCIDKINDNTNNITVLLISTLAGCEENTKWIKRADFRDQLLRDDPLNILTEEEKQLAHSENEFESVYGAKRNYDRKKVDSTQEQKAKATTVPTIPKRPEEPINTNYLKDQESLWLRRQQIIVEKETVEASKLLQILQTKDIPLTVVPEKQVVSTPPSTPESKLSHSKFEKEKNNIMKQLVSKNKVNPVPKNHRPSSSNTTSFEDPYELEMERSRTQSEFQKKRPYKDVNDSKGGEYRNNRNHPPYDSRDYNSRDRRDYRENHKDRDYRDNRDNKERNSYYRDSSRDNTDKDNRDQRDKRPNNYDTSKRYKKY